MHQVIVSDLRKKTNPASKRRLSEQERSFQDADVQRTRYVNAPLQELLCRIQDGQVRGGTTAGRSPGRILYARLLA